MINLSLKELEDVYRVELIEMAAEYVGWDRGRCQI